MRTDNGSDAGLPGIHGGQLDLGSIGDIGKSVNLFRGDINLPLKLVSLSGRNNLDTVVTAFYGSNVNNFVNTWNKDAPTGILGTGWSLPFEKIVVDIGNIGTNYDDKFYLVTEGSTVPLFRTGKNDNAISFQGKNYNFRKVMYYNNPSDPKSERWEIVREDGTRYIYGAVKRGDSYSYGENGSQQWGIKWKNWVGSTANPSGGQYPTAWNLAQIINIWGDCICFEYDNEDVPISRNSGTKYTRSSRIKKITDVYGQTVVFNYSRKENFEIQLPVLPHNQVNAFQFKYEERFLDNINVSSEDGVQIFSLFFNYDFYNVSRKKDDDNYKKRYLKSVKMVNGNGESLPGICFDYYGNNSDINPGAVKSITFPEGGIAAYKYETGKLSNTSVRKEVKSPGEDFTPSVWHGPDYVVVTWFSKRRNKVLVSIYSWGGSWKEWKHELIKNFNIEDFNVINSVNFFTIYFKDLNMGHYRLFLFRHSEYRFGEWEADEAILDNRYTSLSIAAGKDFVSIYCPESTQISIRQWNPFLKRWDESWVESRKFKYLSMAAGSNYFIFSGYNFEAKELYMSLYGCDENRKWKTGGFKTIPGEIDLNYTDFNSFWSAGDCFAAASYITKTEPQSVFYKLLVIGWREDFSIRSVEEYPYSQAIELQSPISRIIMDNSLIGAGQRVLRYNGEKWILKESVIPVLSSNYAYTYGEDTMIICKKTGNTQEFSSMVYDTYEYRWIDGNIKGTVRNEEMAVPSVAGSYCTAANNVYYRDQNLKWNKIYSLPSGADPVSVQNRAPGYLVYKMKNEPSDTYLLFLKDGVVRGGARKIKDENMDTSGGKGEVLAGAFAFVTYKGTKFQDASSLYIYRIVNESIDDKQVDYSVSGVSVYDGYNQTDTVYKYDRNTAAYDPNGRVSQFSKAAAYYKEDDDSFSYTENIYFNGLNPDTEGAAYPDTDRFTNVKKFFSCFNGQIYKSASFNTEGRKVSEKVNYLFAYDRKKDGSFLYGTYTRVRKQVELLYLPPYSTEPLTKTAEYEYNEKGQLAKTATYNFNSQGREEKLTEEKKYGWEVYPELLDTNTLDLEIQTKRRNETNNVTTGIAIDTLKNWSRDGRSKKWGLHKSYRWDGTGQSEDFDYNLWSLKGEPVSGWIKDSEILEMTDKGLVIESVNVDSIHNSNLYDVKERFIVSKIKNAGITLKEAGYYGFEEYENPGGWEVYPASEPKDEYINEGDSYTGTRRLLLQGKPWIKAGLKNTFRINRTNKKFILSCWVKTRKNFSGSGNLSGWEITLSGTASKTLFVPVLPTDETWKFFYHIIDTTAYAIDDANQVELFIYNMQAGEYMLIDNICFAPFNSSLRADVYETGYKLNTASVGLTGETQRTAYDHLQNPTVTVGNGDMPKKLFAGHIWKRYYDAFNPADPNSILEMSVRTGGIHEEFRHGNQWKNNWDVSGDWLPDRRKIVYNGSTTGTLTLKNSDNYTNYGVRFGIFPNETVQRPIGVTIGQKINLQWYNGSWELYDLSAGKQVDSFHQDKMDSKDWFLIAGEHGVIFFADGRQVLGYAFKEKIQGRFQLFTSNKITLDYITVFIDPVVSITYSDNCGRDTQVQMLDDCSVIVQANCYDRLGRKAVTTRMGRFDNQLFGYRKNFVGSIDWIEGVMTGEISDIYPGDEGYPYSRILYEKSPLARKVEQGGPSKIFAINLKTPEESRRTIKTRYLTNTEDGINNDLPAGKYIVTMEIDADKNSFCRISDQLGNKIGEIQGVRADGTDNFAMSRHYFDVYRNNVITKLPNYFRDDITQHENFIINRKFDFFGRITSESEPDTTRPFLRVYDRAGRIRFAQDADGAENGYFIYWLYDSTGRNVEKGICRCDWNEEQLKSNADDKAWLPAPGIFCNKYEYDGDGSDINRIGRLFNVKSTDSEISPRIKVEEELTYNIEGMVIQKTVKSFDYDTGEKHITAYRFDNMRNTVKIIYNDEDNDKFYVNRIFDNLGFLRIISGSDGVFARYEYNPDSSIKTEVFNPGKASEIVRNYTYNEAGWLLKLQDKYFTETLDYTRDGYKGAGFYSGKIARVSCSFDNIKEPDEFVTSYSCRFDYDKLGRLRTAANDRNSTWSMGVETPLLYDSNGNARRWSKGQVKQNFCYYPGTNKVRNEYNSNENSYLYNANGDVIASNYKDISGISYDKASGTVLSISCDQEAVSKNVVFAYDGANKRVYKNNSGTSTLYVLSSNGLPLVERKKDSSGSGIPTFNIYGPTGLIAVRKNNKLYNLIKDHLFSTRAVIDESGVCAAYNYTPFGEFMGRSYEIPGFGMITPYLYTCQEFDMETGLYYYKARFYDPCLGRFYSTDPAGQFTGPYIYSGNDPVGFIDPSGQFSWASLGVLLAGIVVLVGGIALAGFTGGTSLAAAGAVFGGLLAGAGGASAAYGATHMNNFKVSEWGAMVGLGAAFGAISGGLSLIAGGTLMAGGYGIVTNTVLGGVEGFVSNGVSNVMNGQDFFSNALLSVGIGMAAGFAVSGLNMARVRYFKARQNRNGIIFNQGDNKVLNGHGGWNPEEGFVRMPTGKRIKFYCPHDKIVEDSVELGSRIKAGTEPHTEFFASGRRVPNYTLYPPYNVESIPGGITVTHPFTLEQMMNRGVGGEMRWYACRAVIRHRWIAVTALSDSLSDLYPNLSS